ncbi:MAG: hypothetical protein M3497_05040 [Gemmatimonadota bacterium]|nr:hypothetical protein [Gemmatimonadota bacterium]
MPRKKSKSRIYTRNQGGKLRYYGDFRDFADVGGGREALKVQGATLATEDPQVAEKLAGDRLSELQRARRTRGVHGLEAERTLEEFAAHHLVLKAKSHRFTAGWLGETEKRLGSAIAFFGAERANHPAPPERAQQPVQACPE